MDFLSLISTLFLAVWAGGCKKGKSPASGAILPAETNRALDTVYQQALKTQSDLRVRTAAERNQALGQLKSIEARLRATMPKEATEAQILAACEKEPGWAELQAECKAKNDELEKQAVEIRNLIQTRIVQEDLRRQELAGKSQKAAQTGTPQKRKRN